MAERRSACNRAITVCPMVNKLELKIPRTKAPMSNQIQCCTNDIAISNPMTHISRTANKDIKSNFCAYFPPIIAPKIMPTDINVKNAPLITSLMAKLLARSGSKIPHNINTIPRKKKPANMTDVAARRSIDPPILNE